MIPGEAKQWPIRKWQKEQDIEWPQGYRHIGRREWRSTIWTVRKRPRLPVTRTERILELGGSWCEGSRLWKASCPTRDIMTRLDEAIRELDQGKLRDGQRILQELGVENLTTGSALR